MQEINFSETDAARWETLKARDKTGDHRFYYAVLTTGVYCRVSCPSRLPRPENVRFYETAAEAVKAGYRACKRCKPDAASAHAGQANAVAQACRLIEQADETPDFDAIAAAAGMSRFYFHRVFKTAMGLTPGAYHKSVRERRVLRGLSSGASVTEAIYDAGYSSSSRFYEGVAPRLGLKPSAFARGGDGETIRFAVGECSLGAILVAATRKGICAIAFGDDPELLVHDLQDQFPKAELVGADADFEATVAEIVGFVEEPSRGLNLPLHIRGTAFQQRVWTALQTIPAGKTVTYSEIAERIGKPSAVRAVANACAGNALAVAIPCHRVVRTDGSLSGYRWGVERKAALLEREAAA